jgi:hypothetical protein
MVTHLTEFSVVDEGNSFNCVLSKIVNTEYQKCCRKGVDPECLGIRLNYIVGLLILIIASVLV